MYVARSRIVLFDGLNVRFLLYLYEAFDDGSGIFFYCFLQVVFEYGEDGCYNIHTCMTFCTSNRMV